jgi:hypothetical protein
VWPGATGLQGLGAETRYAQLDVTLINSYGPQAVPLRSSAGHGTAVRSFRNPIPCFSLFPSQVPYHAQPFVFNTAANEQPIR